MLLSIGRTGWVEKLTVLAVLLGLFHIIVATFEQLSLHGSNRDTKSQASSLLRAIDFVHGGSYPAPWL